jgi:sec-independent protein translocase protein TatA
MAPTLRYEPVSAMIQSTGIIVEILGVPVMGAFSIWHWLIVLVVVLVLFGGRGKLSSLMGDMAKGINAFKKGLKEGEGTDKVAAETAKPIEAEPQPAVAETPKKDETANG